MAVEDWEWDQCWEKLPARLPFRLRSGSAPSWRPNLKMKRAESGAELENENGESQSREQSGATNSWYWELAPCIGYGCTKNGGCTIFKIEMEVVPFIAVEWRCEGVVNFRLEGGPFPAAQIPSYYRERSGAGKLKWRELEARAEPKIEKFPALNGIGTAGG